MGVCRAPLLLLLAVFLASLTRICLAEAASAGDGSLAKVAPELRAVYEAYKVAHERGQALILPDPAIHVVEDRVIIDAVASGGVEELASSSSR